MAKPCIIGEYCDEHGFIHGAEAEELRSRISRLVDEIGDDSSPDIIHDELQEILDDVDARDSLAWLEQEKRPKPAHEEWKFVGAFFIAPEMTFHPLWPALVGKQRISETRSCPGFLRIITLVRARTAAGENIVHGTYQWSNDHWKLSSESMLDWLPDSVCPEELPGNLEVIDCLPEQDETST